MNKVVVVIMGQDCEDHLEICLESVKDADAIVYCDGGSSKNFMRWLCLEKGFKPRHHSVVPVEISKKVYLQQKYNQNDPEMNGKQRKFYLDYLKKHYEGWLCLCLDADEVLSDNGIAQIRSEIDKFDEKTLYSPRMQHLINNFSHVDATKEKHHVQNRLFFVQEGLEYPLGEHVILRGEGLSTMNYDNIVIWHLAYAPMFHVRSRYRKNLKHSNVHSKQFLHQWYRSHLFGSYPVAKIDVRDLPSSLLQAFDIEKDELYFHDRDLEVKHFLMVQQWSDHLSPEKVLDLGCGRGPYISAWKMNGTHATGVELSEWAASHPVWGCFEDNIVVGDIREVTHDKNYWDLVTFIDVLEHLEEQDLESAIAKGVYACKKFVLASVPFEGDPNLYNDPTHKIFKPRSWWVKQFTKHGLKELPVPDDWLYADQLLLFEINKEKGSKRGEDIA